MAHSTALSAQLFDEGCSVGTVLKSGSPNMAEALGYTDLDFLLLDRQHASPGLETIEAVIRAAGLNDLPVIVRVPQGSLGIVTNVLDAGAAGIMLPGTETVDEVDRLVEAVRYDAGRSYSPNTRAGGFGTRDRDLEAIDDAIAVVPQIESERGLANVDAIASQDAVTTLAIGPLDLSLSLGVDRDSEAFRTGHDELFAAGEDHGCGVGIFVGGPAEVETYRERASFVACGSDIGLVTAVFS